MIDRTRASAIVMTAWAAMACGSSEQQTEAGSGVVPGPAQPAPGSMQGVAGMPSTGGMSGNGTGGGATPSEASGAVDAGGGEEPATGLADPHRPLHRPHGVKPYVDQA